MSRVKLILLVVLVLIVGVSVYFLFFSSNPSGAVTQQLEAMKVGDVNKAYAAMSQEYQRVTSLALFQQQYVNVFMNYRTINFQGDIAPDNSLLVSVELSDGYVEDLQYFLVRDGLSWKINAIEFLTKASEFDGEEINLDSQ